jgi:hydroxymethylglutaryl-CoA synthase
MVGIVGYGAYVPLYRIKTEEIARVWGRDASSVTQGLMIEEKAVPAMDEDSITMGVEASLNALKRANINPKEIGAIYCGSETPAYSVKPNIATIGEAIGATPDMSGADLEFACKAGTAALQVCIGLVKAGYIRYGLAVGSDTAKYGIENIGDHSTGAGAAAFLIGNKESEILAEIEGTYSCTTDTPDFWRRGEEKYPKHAERFTGRPAYFRHTVYAAKALMEKLGLKVSDIDHVVFHSPNGKFILKAAKALGFDKEKIKNGFIVNKIANTYSAASLLGLTAVLDKAKPGERILMTSFGSGAGSDSFSVKVTENIKDKVNLAKTTQQYIERKRYVDYATYCKFTERLE